MHAYVQGIRAALDCLTHSVVIAARVLSSKGRFKNRLGKVLCSRLLLTALCTSLFLGTSAIAESLPLKFYTTADGLPHNNINRIVRDSRGFLWFCTADGLARFDGYTFTTFGTAQGLPSGNVTDFLETREGQYWIATSGGLARFDPESASIRIESDTGRARTAERSMFTLVAPEDPDARAMRVTVLRQDQRGTIWCGTEKGLCAIAEAAGRLVMRTVDIGIPRNYPDQGVVTDILEDSEGLWIATADGLYRRWINGRSARASMADGLPDYFIHGLFQDHLGRLWAATRSAGLFQFASGGSANPVVVLGSYKLRDVVPTSWVFQLFETADHRFWVGTNVGLVEFFPDACGITRKPRLYTTGNGLSYREITALNEDADGNLWVGTNTAGLMKLARNGFLTYGERDGVASANSIFEDRSGGLYLKGAFYAGVNAIRGNPKRYFAFFDGTRFKGFDLAASARAPGWVMENVTLQTRDGEWWVGTGVGILRFSPSDTLLAIKSAKPNVTYTTKNRLAAVQAFRMFEDSRGDVWVSTISTVKNGLARWERSTEKWTDLTSTAGLSSLEDDLPRAFAEDPTGNVWIGFNGHLARYRRGVFAWFSAKEGLPLGTIKNIYLDHLGQLWIASTLSGVIRVEGTDSENPTFVNFTTADGLSSNRAEVITDDLYGNIYVGTGRALDRLNPTTGQVKHFTTADGLAPGLFRAAFRDNTGALWFGMTGGLSRLLPVPDGTSVAPPILLTALEVASARRHVFPFGEISLSLPNLSHNQNRLQIEFVGLDFAPGDTLRYQYRLEGSEWSAASEQRSISFANLAPGKYNFLVRAVSSAGTISAVPASVVFRVLPPLWQRWWFLTIVAMGIVACAWTAYRYRMAQVLEIANVRTRIATDLHDDIGSNLSKIAILSEVARQQLRDKGQLPEDNPLSVIADISRESVASMSDIVWAINPHRDRLLDLVRRMRQHAEHVFTARGVKLVFRAPGENQDIKLRTEVRRDVFLIFKEAVNNAARHAKCSHAEIDLRVEDGCLSLDISDDGVGFDPAVISDGHGLANMRRRAERLGGVCEVRRSNGKSTIVHVAIRTRRPPVSLHR